MIRDTFDAIVNNINVRQNLSLLKQELKDSNNKNALLFYIGNQYNNMFQELLEHDDPKTRKNMAAVLGELGKQEFLASLYHAYLRETKLFVKSSYLNAIKELDYRSLLPDLKKRIDELTGMNVSEENKKHFQEEMRALSDLVVMMEGVKAHKFIGMKKVSEIILLTNRNHIQTTMNELPATVRAKAFNAGVQVKTPSLEEIIPIRTYQELLFLVDGMRSCPMDVEEAANIVAKSNFLNFLQERHEGNPPFYFRLEIKTKMEANKKAVFAKRLAAAIEEKTERTLINSTSHYEVELRLVENKEGKFNILVKLFTLKDERFDYRIENVAASIRPVNAALTMALVKEYLKEDAQILDPFCGVGTMLIERHKLVKANTMYGIDIFGDAIKKARMNADEAHQIIHFINRDFFDFKHEYLFDEVVVDMPFAIGRVREEEVKQIYIQFFKKIKEHLQKDAVMILYTHDKGLVRKYAPANGFEVIKEYEVSMKEGTYVFVLKEKHK